MASLVALSLSNRHARVSVCYEEHLSRADVSSVKLHFYDIMVIGLKPKQSVCFNGIRTDFSTLQLKINPKAAKQPGLLRGALLAAVLDMHI